MQDLGSPTSENTIMNASKLLRSWSRLSLGVKGQFKEPLGEFVTFCNISCYLLPLNHQMGKETEVGTGYIEQNKTREKLRGHQFLSRRP